MFKPLNSLKFINGLIYKFRKVWSEMAKKASCKTPNSYSPTIFPLKREKNKIM